VQVPADNVRGKKLDEVIAFRKTISAPIQSRSVFKNDTWLPFTVLQTRNMRDPFKRCSVATGIKHD